MSRYLEVQEELRRHPRRWVVTGVAGFIGSHLLETLLGLEQEVVGIDNFATGYRRNLEDVAARVGDKAFRRFDFIPADVRDGEVCAAAFKDANFVLHQAALGSVPRSMVEPLASHAANVDGFVSILLAAQSAGVSRVVFASSSSVYGDEPTEPKVEERRGRLLSPYAATKLIDEIYAETFRRTHDIDSVGLRYFNVFGPRQDPHGAYAAVIPRWTEQILLGEPCAVFGDGTASRDFCYVDNVVQANLLAALAPRENLEDQFFNIACGDRTVLTELFELIRGLAARSNPDAQHAVLRREAPRPGDILHSRASIERARKCLGYEPSFDVARGMQETVKFYAERVATSTAPSGSLPVAPPASRAAS